MKTDFTNSKRNQTNTFLLHQFLMAGEYKTKDKSDVDSFAEFTIKSSYFVCCQIYDHIQQRINERCAAIP